MSGSIQHIFLQNDKNTVKKLNTFKGILRRIFFRIKMNLRLKKNCLLYEVPHFIMGEPIYDIKICLVFLISELRKKQFYVKFKAPNLLYISWEHFHRIPPSMLTVDEEKMVKKTKEEPDSVFASADYGTRMKNLNEKLMKSL